jgi:hypothetical protein
LDKAAGDEKSVNTSRDPSFPETLSVDFFSLYALMPFGSFSRKKNISKSSICSTVRSQKNSNATSDEKFQRYSRYYSLRDNTMGLSDLRNLPAN